MFRDLDAFGEFGKGRLAEGEGWIKFERVFTPREAWIALRHTVGNIDWYIWTLVEGRVAWAPDKGSIKKLF